MGGNVSIRALDEHLKSHVYTDVSAVSLLCLYMFYGRATSNVHMYYAISAV